MTPGELAPDRGRKYFLTGAIIVFFLLSGLMLLSTTGWVWEPQAHRFIRLAALYVSSEPRANIILNGDKIGLTPMRMHRLRPGRYRLELSQSGYAAWSKDLDLSAGVAQSVAPVKLFPLTKPARVSLMPATTMSVYDEMAKNIWLVAPGVKDGFSSVTSSTSEPVLLSWPFKPNRMVSSPKKRLVLAASNSDMALTLTDGSSQPWAIPWLEDLVWSNDSDDIVYGRSERRVLKIDWRSRTIEYIADADSLSSDQARLWLAIHDGDQTTIWRRDETKASRPVQIGRLLGRWLFSSTAGTAPILRQVDNVATVRVSGNQTTGFHLVNWVEMDRLWLLGNNRVWQHGIDLETAADGRVRLVDRLVEPLQWVSWYAPGRVLVTADNREIRVFDLEQLSGRSLMYSTKLPADAQIIGSLPDQTGFWFRINQEIWRWSWSNR